MNTNINQLLEKYWAGDSSLKDEKEIRAYFAGDHIAEEHKSIAPLFGLFSLKQDDSYNKDLSTVLNSTLTGGAKRDTEVRPKRSSKVFQLRKFVMAIAAVFATVMTAVIVMNHDANLIDDNPIMASNKIILDGSDDSDEALRVTKKALVFLSGKLKKNGKKVNSGIQNLDKINVVN